MKKICCFVIMILLVLSLISAASAAAFDGSPEAVYNAMIALKQKYPEGKKWTNDNYYGWKGGIYSGKVVFECAGRKIAAMPVSLEVLPFSLPKNPAWSPAAPHFSSSRPIPTRSVSSSGLRWPIGWNG